MAVTLTITDGTDTVNFNDTTNLSLSSDFQMNVSDQPVSELLISGWVAGVDGDAKALISKKYNRLIRKAIQHYQEQRIDRAVWMVFKPDDQTDTQYAKVMGGGEVEIVWHTIGGLGGGRFAPSVIREGPWRSFPPDGTAGAAIWSGVALFNKSDGDGNNWADLASSRTNDAPAFLKITSDIVLAGAPATIVIATKRGPDATFLNKFNPHFNATDLTAYTGGTLQTDLTAAGDQRLEQTATGTPYWTIADTDIIAYDGNYNVYVSGYMASGTGKVRIQTAYFTGEWYTLSGSAVQNLLYIGNLSFPGTLFNPFVTVSTSSDMQLQLDYEELTAGTAYIMELFLVPTDIPPIECSFNNSGGSEIVIDGVNQMAYVRDASANQILLTSAGIPTTVKGRYPTSIGGQVNRLFFYFWGPENSGFLTVFEAEATIAIDVEITDRFVGLRGNT